MTNAAQQLHQLGQSLWLDNLTRDLLDSGTLQDYIDTFAVSGLTSNPTIFQHAFKGADYDAAIRSKLRGGRAGEALFLELALEDIRRAADLFRPTFERTCGVDGWVSLEVSPLLVNDTQGTLAQARDLHARAGRPNLFIKIPGTAAGVPAIEEAIFSGIPVNVTLLFSREQYLASADAYLRGLERRVAAGLAPDVASVASVFVSRWDVAVASRVPAGLHNRLGIAVAQRCYRGYVELLAGTRCQRLMNVGARPQRLLLASTGTKDPKAPDVLYVEALAAPLTVNTMPDATLRAFAAHGTVSAALPQQAAQAEQTLRQFADAGIDIDALAEQLQREGEQSFTRSWNDLLAVIDAKSSALGAAA